MAKTPQDGDEGRPTASTRTGRTAKPHKEKPFNLPMFAENEPTQAERRLVWAAKVGDVAWVGDLSEAEKTVRPALLRWLCQNSRDPDHVDMHGILLSGAIIPGTLDLDYLDIGVPLWLDFCKIEKLSLRARLRELSLDNSTITDGVDAHRAQVDGNWYMRGAEVAGPFTISGAILEGQFSANGAHFRGKDSDAIIAQGVKATGWFMNAAEVDGCFDINSAALDGQFNANGAHFRVKDGDAINAQGVKATDWFMRGAKVDGHFDINGAVLAGQFSANGAHFRGKVGDAITAQGLKAAGWFMHLAEVDGRFDINGAVLEGQFGAKGAHFRVKDGDAINAQAVKAAGWIMRNGCRAAGHINLSGTQMQVLDLSDSTVDARGSVAISLVNARCENVFAAPGFSALGAFVCDGAKITGVLLLRKAHILAGAFEAPDAANESYGHTLAISAVDAEIGRLALPETIGTKAGPNVVGVIDLSHARIGTLEDYRAGWYPPVEPTHRLRPWLQKNRATRWSTLEPNDKRWDIQHLVLDGTVYEHLEHPNGTVNGDGEPNWRARMRWLMSQGRSQLRQCFNPQPWQQLAQTFARMGYEEDARQIAIQRRILQRAAEPNLFMRLVSFLLQIFANYGFSPWRTVLWSIGVVVLCGAIYAGLGQCAFDCPIAFGAGTDLRQIASGEFIGVAGDVLAEANNDGGVGQYPAFNPWFYSLDLFIPILDLGSDAYWRPISLAGYVLSVIEQILGAFLVALAVTGFTGLLTRDERL